MRKWQEGWTAGELLIVVWAMILLVGALGWVLNIVDLAHMNFAHITGMLVIRAIGIVVAPLGAVMGYV